MSIRITNHPETGAAVTKIQYVDRPIEVAPQMIISEPEIHYVDREVIKEVYAPASGEQIMIPQEVDLNPIHEQIEQIKMVVDHNTKFHNEYLENLRLNSDMQSRALIALKSQRDIDRSRRLMLIKRIKKERNALRDEQISHKKIELKLKIVMGVGILISIASLFIKL
jgi:hypothetical protein